MKHQEVIIADKTIEIAKTKGDFEAQVYFNQATETWPIWVVVALGEKIREMRSTVVHNANDPLPDEIVGNDTIL